MRVAVGRDHDLVGVERLERLDALVLAELGARLDGERGEAPDPAGRLKRPIGRMEDRAVEPPGQRLRELVVPLDGEAVLAQRLVLGLELGALGCVRGQAEAAGAPESVAGQLLEPVEVALGQHPEGARPLRAQLPPATS